MVPRWQGLRLVAADASVLMPAIRNCHRTRSPASADQRLFALSLPQAELTLHACVHSAAQCAWPGEPGSAGCRLITRPGPKRPKKPSPNTNIQPAKTTQSGRCEATTRAIVEEAHKLGLKVVGHSHLPEEIRIGLKTGIDNFEHTGLSSAPSYPDDIIRAITERTAQMSKGPLFWTPTIEGLYNHQDLIDNPEKVDDPSWHLGLPDSVISDIRNSIAKPGQLSYYQLTPLRKPTLETKFRQLQKTGVVMLIGTDSGIPMKFHSQSTWNELDVWVRAFGVDPLQAIKSATYWPSVFMGVSDKVGTITPGKQADIIAVRGDVLRHINLLQRVDIVIKKGKRYK
jgi:imidazolonepropionase-like amidohydrolase